MKNVIVIVLFIFAFLFFSCAKSDSGGEKQDVKITTSAAPTDSVTIDSTATDLQKATKDLKKEADDVQKSVDDLLK
jgi:translation initiation factor 2 alpha subunit (eIF-2alpha)